jgi:hypothetical protein
MDSAGVEATLYIPTDASLVAAEGLDVFELTSNHTYVSYTVLCFVEWNPSKYRLKKLGIYTEDELPILVWIPLVATALEGDSIGQQVDIDVVQKSYLQINPEFIPDNTSDTQEFEVVDLTIKGTHDAVILKGAKCVPRRIQIKPPV